MQLANWEERWKKKGLRTGRTLAENIKAKDKDEIEKW